jgi:hypothetical protein
VERYGACLVHELQHGNTLAVQVFDRHANDRARAVAALSVGGGVEAAIEVSVRNIDGLAGRGNVPADALRDRHFIDEPARKLGRQLLPIFRDEKERTPTSDVLRACCTPAVTLRGFGSRGRMGALAPIGLQQHFRRFLEHFKQGLQLERTRDRTSHIDNRL